MPLSKTTIGLELFKEVIKQGSAAFMHVDKEVYPDSGTPFYG
jgi:hypothetical protein